MGHSRWIRIVAILAFGALCFAAGALATRREPPPPPPAAPQILIDAGSIELMPDASLELRLPPPPDVDAGP